MTIVELNNIIAGYVKGQPILSNFNLSVESGELLSLLGPSGCGKTTTLRTIAGFVAVESGRIVINGQDCTNIPPNRRNIGLVFQNYALFPHLSVFENVAYGLKRRRIDRRDIRLRVHRALEMIALERFAERLPAQLSGGQRQRVALARAIVIEPNLLLLDEPLSNLDSRLREEMRAELIRLQHQLNITMIYVTHDQIEALSLSSRVIVMNEGRIEQIGTPEEIYEHPSTAFVARFLGFENQIAAVVQRYDRDAIILDAGGSVLVGTPPKNRQLAVGDPVHILFRPGDVSLVDAASENVLPISVVFANYQGSTTLFSVRAGDDRFNVVMPGRPAALSSYTHIHIPPSKLIVEPRSGN